MENEGKIGGRVRVELTITEHMLGGPNEIS
jgi:hypothetical protein